MRSGAKLKAIILTAALAATLALAPSSCRKTPEITEPNTIKVGSIGDAERLIPFLASDTSSSSITGQVYSGLVRYDENIVLEGELAESWDISPDGLEIIFHLRKGVKWHDGEPFTSEDVVFTYEKVTDPKVPTPYVGEFELVESVEALDEHTVRVRYKKPFAPALESWGIGIIAKHLLEGKDITKEEFTRHPVGTGPYKFKEWVTGQKIVLEANDEYFEGRPNVDRYIMRVIPDTATMFLELKFGGLDYMGLTPPQYKLQANTEYFERNFQKFRFPAFAYTYMGYNHLDPKFKDRNVRRALTHAIDKQELIDGVLLGYGTPCTGPFPPESWAYNPDAKGPEYDPEKAKKLLAEAGWKPGKNGVLYKDGEPFSFTLLTNQGNNARIKAAQIIKEQLEKVGVDVEIQVLEWQALLHKYIDKKRFEAIIIGWSLGRDPDAYIIWHSSQNAERQYNFISYKNEEVDRLLVEGRQTFDMERRKEIYHRIHELLAEDQPYTFLYVPDSLPVLHSRFKGVEKAPIGIWHDFIKWRVPEDRSQWHMQP